MDITSPSNPKLKYVVRLRSCSTREESGEMIVEGYRECRRALDLGYRPRAIFHCPDLYLKSENEPALVADAQKAGAEVYTCSKVCFEKIAYKERPDGLLMVGPHVSIKLKDLKLPENALVIVTEAIEKPDNVEAFPSSPSSCAILQIAPTTHQLSRPPRAAGEMRRGRRRGW